MKQAYEIHHQKQWRNSMYADAVALSSKRPLTRSALQPAHRAGASQLDMSLHPGQPPSHATYCVSIGITWPTKSLVPTISSSGVTVLNRELSAQRHKRKNRALRVFSSDLLPTHQGRRASASTSLAFGSRSCLVTANGPMLSIGTARSPRKSPRSPRQSCAFRPGLPSTRRRRCTAPMPTGRTSPR